jgi:hypothetical protein
MTLLGKKSLTSIHKLFFYYQEEKMYNKWVEVFAAWELGKLIGEDGRKPKKIPKVPYLDITMNDVDWILETQSYTNLRKLLLQTKW